MNKWMNVPSLPSKEMQIICGDARSIGVYLLIPHLSMWG